MLTVAQIKGRQLIPGEIPVERRCVRSFHMREFLAGDRRNEYPAFSAWILVSFTQFGTISMGLNAQDGWLKSLLRAIKAAQDGRISRKGHLRWSELQNIRISEELAGRMKPFSDVGWSHSSMQLPHLAQEILRWRHK